MQLYLHPKQALAFQSEATEILFGGAAGGGKSHFLRVAGIIWCCLVPGIQVYIFRRTYPDLVQNHMEGPTGFPMLLADWCNSGHAKINFSDNDIRIGTEGSKIHLRHCQYEKNRFSYQGAEMHILMIDELTHFTETIYRYLRSRARIPEALTVPESLRGRLPMVINGTNPGGVGHTWVKQTFVDSTSPLEVRQMPKIEGGMLRQFIPSLLEDNPSLDTEEYEGKLEGLGSPELVKAMRTGAWDINLGGMFSDLWSRERHIIEPFNVPPGWTVNRSFDWGSSAPFSVGWHAESNGEDVKLSDKSTLTFPKGTLFRIHEWYGWNGTANQGCKMISSEIARGIRDREETLVDTICKAHTVKAGPADTSIFDIREGRSIADEMAAAGISWTKADKGPGSRRNGWEVMRRMFKASLQAPMEEPGYFVFDTCHQFIRTIPDLPRSERDMEDVDTDAEDHIADEARYRCTQSRRIASSRHWAMG